MPGKQFMNIFATAMKLVTRAIPRGDSKTCFPTLGGTAATLRKNSCTGGIKWIAGNLS
jgi:hypothetical protein